MLLNEHNKAICDLTAQSLDHRCRLRLVQSYIFTTKGLTDLELFLKNEVKNELSKRSNHRVPKGSSPLNCEAFKSSSVILNDTESSEQRIT